jgi:hypothetical protein
MILISIDLRTVSNILSTNDLESDILCLVIYGGTSTANQSPV